MLQSPELQSQEHLKNLAKKWTGVLFWSFGLSQGKPGTDRAVLLSCLDADKSLLQLDNDEFFALLEMITPMLKKAAYERVSRGNKKNLWQKIFSTSSVVHKKLEGNQNDPSGVKKTPEQQFNESIDGMINDLKSARKELMTTADASPEIRVARNRVIKTLLEADYYQLNKGGRKRANVSIIRKLLKKKIAPAPQYSWERDPMVSFFGYFLLEGNSFPNQTIQKVLDSYGANISDDHTRVETVIDSFLSAAIGYEDQLTKVLEIYKNSHLNTPQAERITPIVTMALAYLQSKPDKVYGMSE
jgi:hypothetical protein